MAKSTPKTTISRVELAGGCDKILKKLADQLGMTQLTLLSRLLQWFINEPATIQAIVLGAYAPEISAEVAELLLKKMKKD